MNKCLEASGYLIEIIVWFASVCEYFVCAWLAAHGGHMSVSGVFLRKQPPWHIFSFEFAFCLVWFLVFWDRISCWYSRLTEEARQTVSQNPVPPPSSQHRDNVDAPNPRLFILHKLSQAQVPPGWVISIYWLHYLCRSLKYLFIFKYGIVAKITIYKCYCLWAIHCCKCCHEKS